MITLARYGVSVLDVLCTPVTLPACPYSTFPTGTQHHPASVEEARALLSSERPLRHLLSVELLSTFDKTRLDYLPNFTQDFGSPLHTTACANYCEMFQDYLDALDVVIRQYASNLADSMASRTPVHTVLNDMSNKLRWVFFSPLLSSTAICSHTPLPLLTPGSLTSMSAMLTLFSTALAEVCSVFTVVVTISCISVDR